MFKVGDEVRALPRTDHVYGVTTHRDGWSGEILRVRPTGNFDAITLKHNKTSVIGKKYYNLDYDYFEVISKRASYIKKNYHV